MSRLILIGGGSSSGKSYITKTVLKEINSDEVLVMTMDDYYKDQSDMELEDRYKVNYDHPKSIDWKLFRKHIKMLKNGQSIEKPIYDFKTLNRTKETEIVEPKSLIIIEGIMALVDEDVRSLSDLKVFVTASAERRFLRRAIRDKADRGRSIEKIINQYFYTVQPMYDEIVKPSSMYADLIINNDGIENRSIDVLKCLFIDELNRAKRNESSNKKGLKEFSIENLNSVFKE